MEKKVRNSHTTLPHTLGELELCVMKAIWQCQNMDAKQVLAQVAVDRHANLSTIQSTLERLVRKGLLLREKQGYAYVYSVGVSRAELLSNLLKDVIHLLHDGKADTILSSFVNVSVKIDDTALEKLELLIQQKREQLDATND